jgi:quinol monooxygenase YgiN
MPIYTIAEYRVRASGVEKVKRAIEEFVPYVASNEPGTRVYVAWQQQADPTRFVHFFIFENEEAHVIHGRSDAVKRFEAAYRPELEGGNVVFTDYDMVATNTASIRHAVQIAARPEAIYPLVATAAGLRKWWAEDVTESSGGVDLGFFNRTTMYRLRLSTDRPAAEAVWGCETGAEWSGTEIAFALEPRGDGTLLRFAHRRWRSETEYFTSCNTTWGELMYRLKAAAEGKSAGPLFLTAALGY